MFARIRNYVRRNGIGLGGSIGLHLALLLLVLWMTPQLGRHLSHSVAMVVPIDLVRLGLDSQVPRAGSRDAPPQQSAPPTPKRDAASPTDGGVSPHGIRPPRDALEAKLRDLARLSQPADRPRDLDTGVSNLTAGGGDGDAAVYGVKDYIRAQVLRRWSLDLVKLGGRKLIVRIRMAIKADGTLLSASVLDDAPDDVLYRDIAIGARNAVLLSAPFQLPPGSLPARMDFVLDLNPRDARR